jgi:hypothetical protein
MYDTEPNVILYGGPSSLPLDERIRYVENTADKFKLLRENHYEHFEPTPQVERRFGRDLRVFAWTGFTRVAE